MCGGGQGVVGVYGWWGYGMVVQGWWGLEVVECGGPGVVWVKGVVGV